MKQIRNITVAILLLTGILSAQTSKNEFIINVNSQTGGIQKIMNGDDKYNMNWIICSNGSQYSWETNEFAWGLGYVEVIKNGEKHLYNWEKLKSISKNGNETRYEYKLPDIKVCVTRSIDSQRRFCETYRFTNTSDTKITISNTGIYTPMNDNYVDAETCEKTRCNAHIWAGNHASYINAIRMGGNAPHLGLVLTEGDICGYELINIERDNENKGGSNFRGGITLDLPEIKIEPGGSRQISWKLFWHTGWEDFFVQAKQLGFVEASADKYTVQQNEKTTVHFSSSTKLDQVFLTVNNKPVIFQQNGNEIIATIKPDQLGNNEIRLYYNKSYTVCNVLATIPIKSMIKNRIDFILDKQQMNDKSDPRYGAYMVYDNETESIYKDNYLNLPSPVDLDEGAERTGMALLIAKWMEQNPKVNPSIMTSLTNYYNFLRNKLQTPDYKLFSSIEHKERHRGYNYPWAASFYFEMYALTHEKKYVIDGYKTMRKFYREFNYEFYAINVPVERSIVLLRNAGFKMEADTLLNNFVKVGNEYIKNGIYYPAHEVNYEQSIVAPACMFFLEMYSLTNNEQYLTESKKHLQLLDAFAGLQPDFHLNQISIRHWDDYWFGKRSSWGDVMPHYWSALSGRAYLLYYNATGDKKYLLKGEICLSAQLTNITQNGRGSCAYIYTNKVNGRPGKFFDPFANDQDWGIYYYLEMINTLKKNYNNIRHI